MLNIKTLSSLKENPIKELRISSAVTLKITFFKNKLEFFANSLQSFHEMLRFYFQIFKLRLEQWHFSFQRK